MPTRPFDYDRIGRGYSRYRQPDPVIGSAIELALGDAVSIVNVGAGSGSYEPSDRTVIAVEPSMTMIRQRPLGSAPAVQASATALPFRDRAFDAAMALLSVHHWSDQPRGLAELRRVTRGPVVILTWDPSHRGFWLGDYLPSMMETDRRIFPELNTYQASLGPVRMVPVPIPANCTDGFMGAYWRRPEAYLDAGVRSAISTFSKLGDIEPFLAQLRHDLESGEWRRRYGELLGSSELDLGYRLVITD